MLQPSADNKVHKEYTVNAFLPNIHKVQFKAKDGTMVTYNAMEISQLVKADPLSADAKARAIQRNMFDYGYDGYEQDDFMMYEEALENLQEAQQEFKFAKRLFARLNGQRSRQTAGY